MSGTRGVGITFAAAFLCFVASSAPALARGPFPGAPSLFNARAARFVHSTSVNNPGADTTGLDTQGDTSIAVLGPRAVVAFGDSGGGSGHGSGFASSGNTGNTWIDGGALPPSVDGDGGDPVLASMTDAGTIFLATLKPNGEGIELFRSTSGGQTWSAPINAVPEAVGTGDSLDKPWIAVNNKPGMFHDEITICYTRSSFGGGEEIRAVQSTTRGTNFLPSFVVNAAGGQGCNVTYGFDPHGGGNTLYASYYQGSGAGGQGAGNALYMNAYNQVGAAANEPSGQGPAARTHVLLAALNTTTVNGDLNLNGGFRSNSFPQAAVNPSNGDVFVVFNDDPSVGSNADNGDIYYARSTDAGATWSIPAVVNNDTAHDQFFPSVAVSPSGADIGFGYYSRVDDSANLMFHRRGRQGVILGSGAIQLHNSYQLGPDTPVVVNQDPGVGNGQMGGYDQVLAAGDAFYESWSDNRTGNAFHQFQPDVHFARITVTRTDADVGVTATANPSSIPVGSHTTIKVTTTATGGPASDVYVHVNPVTGLNLKSASGADCRVIRQFASCRIGDLAAGASRAFNIGAFGALPAGSRVIKAVATSSSRDSAQANNTGSATVTTTGSGVATTYSSGNIAVPIADNSTAEVPITVPNVGSVLKVRPGVRLNHAFDSDLDIFVVDPAGTTVELSTDNGGGGFNYGTGANSCAGTPTSFDDAAATPITAGSAPFTGVFRPEAVLGDMIGDGTGGTWKLRVTDDANIDTGTIGCVRLKITHP